MQPVNPGEPIFFTGHFEPAFSQYGGELMSAVVNTPQEPMLLRTDADGAIEFRIDAAGHLRHQTFARPQ